MGKKKGGKAKSFINPRTDVCYKFTIAKNVPAEKAAEHFLDVQAAVPIKSKKVNFELICKASADSGQLPTLNDSESSNVPLAPPVLQDTDFPELGTRREKRSAPINVKNSHHSEAFPVDDEVNDPNDLTQYGIYFNDGYDYSQHLREPNIYEWDEELVETVQKDHPQKGKKDRKRQHQIQNETPKADVPVIPNFSNFCEYTDETEVLSNTADEYDELFDDAESDTEFPDNVMDFLNGGETLDSNNLHDGDICSQRDRDGEGCSYGQTVDYSDMPPLEELDEELFQNDEPSEDSASDASSDCMNVSDISLTDDEDEQCGAETLQEPNINHQELLHSASTDVIPDKIKSKQTKVQKNDIRSELDKFFDGVAEQSEDEGEEEESASNKHMVPVMQSSKVVKPMSREMDMFNEQFAALLARQYGETDLGDAKMDEVEGFLSEDAPQFKKAVSSLRTKKGEEVVKLVGPDCEAESREEAELRMKALEYCRNWKDRKMELVEVSVPLPMKYNVSNLPSVKNKNKPSIIKPDLQAYFSNKRKGLRIKELKQHDLEVNAPISQCGEDAQTYKTMLTELSYRPPDEKTEERRDRKLALKELRKGRREEKKRNSLAHKNMLLRIARIKINAKHCRNISMI